MGGTVPQSENQQRLSGMLPLRTPLSDEGPAASSEGALWDRMLWGCA